MTAFAHAAAVVALLLFTLAAVLPLVGAGPAAAWAAGGGLVAFIGVLASYFRQSPPPEE